MPRKCSVISCTSLKQNPNITLFKAPSSSLDAWKEVIYRINCGDHRKVTHVCSEHFTHDDLITKYASVPKDVEEFVGKRDRCGLRKGAIPSIFKCSTDTSKTNITTTTSSKYTVLSKHVIEQLQKQKFITTTTPVLQYVGQNTQNKDATPSIPQSRKILQYVGQRTQSIDTISSPTFTRKIDNTFDLPESLNKNVPIVPQYEEVCTTPNLQKQLEGFKELLSSIGWLFYSDGSTISMYQPTKTASGNIRIVIQKQIVFQSSTLDINYYVNQKRIESEVLGLNKLTYPLNTAQLTKTILMFNNKKICQGGPCISDFPGIHVKTAHLEDSRIWYHNKCSIVTDSKIRCKKCNFMIKYFGNCQKKKLLAKTKPKINKSTKRVKRSTNLKNPIKHFDVLEEEIEEPIEIVYV